MRLRNFRVRGFRCIQDSGVVPVGDLAALIGKNESGKTALLQALVHLKKDQPIKELDLCDEMGEVFEQDANFRVVEGTFELQEKETRAIAEQIAEAPEVKGVHMYRSTKGDVQYEFSDVEFGNRVEIDSPTKSAFEKDLDALRTLLLPMMKDTDSGPALLHH